MPASVKRGLGIAAATAALLMAGLALLWHLTRGLTSFTTESWRRAAILESPRALPEVVLEDHLGQSVALRSLCGRVLVINFVYTHCPGVCSALGAGAAQMALRMQDVMADGRVAVLSISFDPQRDTPKHLARFKRGLDASGSAWRVLRAPSQADTQTLLELMGVVVIDDRRGGFDHNAAWHVVDRSCQLRRIMDLEDTDAVEALVRSWL